MNSNAIQTMGSFNVVRTNKAGKQTARDFAGVVSSGNKSERQQALQALVTHHYCEGQFGMLAVNMVRVFGANFTTIAKFAKVSTVTGGATDKAVRSARQGWEMVVESLQPTDGEKPLKGERLMWAEVLRNAKLTYDARRKSMQDAALQAQQDAGLLVDADATVIANEAPATEVLTITNDAGDAAVEVNANEVVNADATPIEA